jgi:menaquinone-dependent protoporphyrinogen IX oxidase
VSLEFLATDRNSRAANVYYSQHHGNTNQIAKTMASELDAQFFTAGCVTEEQLYNFDLIGLGSGIYFGGHLPLHCELVRKARNLPNESFVSSTAGLAQPG